MNNQSRIEKICTGRSTDKLMSMFRWPDERMDAGCMNMGRAVQSQSTINGQMG